MAVRTVEKVDSPIGDENLFAFCLVIFLVPGRESRFPDRGRKPTFARSTGNSPIVEKVDSPIGDENTASIHIMCRLF